MAVMARGLLGGLACVLVGACSPYDSNGAFACTDNSQCDPGGTCSTGFCAFPDSSCSSGLKYGGLAGTMSNQCVGATMGSADAGVDSKIFMDAAIDSPPGQFCFGANNPLVKPCFATNPTGTVTLSADFNTDTGPCDTTLNSIAACVKSGGDIELPSGTVHVTGSKPLVLVASGSISIGGTLDVASHIGGQTGAAADGSACHASTGQSTGGGGAGGSFGGQGGNGAGTATNATAGGTAGAVVTVTTLQGGCIGQNGNGGAPGAGGKGGGAVFLIGKTSISISGTVNASGAGGGGATSGSAGGGGGGSGGYIGLDSQLVMVTGNVFANGGGGGQGSGSTTFGNAGSDPAMANTAAAGGLAGTGGSSTYGGSGGAGAAGSTLTGTAGTAGNTAGGGGAGGGGAGIIRVFPSQTLGGSVSPNPS